MLDMGCRRHPDQVLVRRDAREVLGEVVGGGRRIDEAVLELHGEAALEMHDDRMEHRCAGRHPECRRHLRTRSEEHTSELQSLMRISYAVFCLKKKNINTVSNS